MASIVELKYNPFIPRLSILIDGQSPSEYSQLVQYADEDIIKWGFYICKTIYSEIRDDYIIIFTGTNSDAEFLKVVARKESHCKSFKHLNFLIDTPVNKRMIALQKCIAENNISQYEINRIGYRLFIEKDVDINKDLIKDKMNISNRFCIVSEASTKSSQIYNFVISTQQKDYTSLTDENCAEYTFVIIIGDKTNLIDVDSRCSYYCSKAENVIQAIFTCLLSFPLTIALRNTYNSIQTKKYLKDLQLSVAIEPVVKVRLDSVPELGKTAKIITQFFPEDLSQPKLLYKIQNNAIASCNGIYVSGKTVGTTKLEVYKYGESVPADIVEITVIKRNRIKDLILSQDQLLLGVGDKVSLSVEHLPEDADNVGEIKWESTNENVLCVNNGRIQAVGIGSCRVICTAENVSAQCLCTVKEYLKDIIVQPEFENNSIVLTPMEEIQLSIINVPQYVVDGEIYISSSNNDIVNPIGTKLVGKNPGNARIQIYNSSKTIVKTFLVSVSSPKKGIGLIQKIKDWLGLE